jgi:thioredoxin reductase (NADPH)
MYDIIIIGAGVAGFSAAVFTTRRGLKTLVIGKDVGGQANWTDTIENFPGHPQVGGFELVASIRKQAESFGAEFMEAEVNNVKPVGDSTFIVTAYGKQYKSAVVILAYGKTPQDLGVAGENELKGKGVSYCATCDAPLYKDMAVAVVGVGDIAADAAILCAKFARKVYVLSKTDKFTAHPGLTKALFKKPNVELVPFAQIQKITGDGRVSGLQILNFQTDKSSNLEVDGVFVELGYVVNSQLVQNVVKLDDEGQVITNSDQSTSVPGIFAAGDATNRLYKQAVISAGEGAAAGPAAYDWLMRQKGGVGLSSDWTSMKKIK